MRAGLVLFVAFCLLASVLAPAASGQSQQASWYVNDNPGLNGPSRYWWAGDAGKGYGSNNYVYTYGTAGESSTGNWARWSMGKRVGRQEIQAYVPNTRATATVLYRIDIGGTQHTKSVAQRDAFGWTSLGAYDADGDTVTITLRDNEASQHWNRHGENNSSIGVDAIRMRCISSCSTGPEIIVVPTPTQAPRVDEPSAPRSLRVSADEDSAAVSWSAPSDNGGAAISGYRADLYRGSTRVDRKNLSSSQRSTTFTGLSADTAYQVRIQAQNSAGRGDRATASFRTDAAPQPRASAPGAPRIVGFVNGADTVGVVWNPPSDNGGAPITGYTIDLHHNNRRIDTKTVASGVRETTFTGLSADTAYQVRITAHNTAGTSNPTVANARTGTATRPPSTPRSLRVSADEDSATASWNPPSDDGGAAISGYRADLYRGNTRVDRKNLTASQRSATFTGLSADTAYQIRLSAENSAGRSASATANFRTGTAPQRQQARSVTIALAADRAGCSDQSSPCRWLSASYSGFAPGNYRVRCYWSTSRSSLGSQFASFTTSRINGTNPALCYFNGTPGRHLTAVIDGVQSNTIQFTGTPPAPQATAPSAPRNLRVTADEDSANATWSAPSDDGGAPISGYRADLYRGSTRIERKSLTASQRTATFTGLSADTAYQIRVSAQNSAGTSNPTTANTQTNARQPQVSAPSAPRNLRVTADEDSANATWSAPSDDGGAPISGYRADLYRGSTRIERKSLTASQRTATFTGLSADTAHQIRVSAENSAGRGDRATASFRTDPARQPQAVRSVTIALAADRVGCSDPPKPCRWLSASYSGFAPGTYRVRCYWSTSPNSLGSQFASFTTSRASGTNPTLCWYNGTPGRYLTAVIDGVQSNTIQFAGTPPTPQASAPSAPRIVGFDNGTDTVGVTWNPPSDNGGAAITGYTVDLYRNNRRIDSKTLSAQTRETEFKNLSPDTAYQVRITARNTAGTSNPTVTNTRTLPAPTRQESGLPSEPRSVRVTASENQATVSWSPPASNGGNPLTGYQVELLRGGSFITRNTLPTSNRLTSFSNLRADTTYTVLVSAKNNQGLSTPTAADFTTEAPEETRSVTISLGADPANCQDALKPCQLNASLSGFSPGIYRAGCYSSRSQRHLGTGFWIGTVNIRSGSDFTFCSFNPAPGMYLTAVIAGIQSNTVYIPSPPGTPRNIRTVPLNSNQIRVTWDRPADSGTSPISHYEITYARAKIGRLGSWNNTYIVEHGTTHTLRTAIVGLTYKITVRAISQAGSSILKDASQIQYVHTNFDRTASAKSGVNRTITKGVESIELIGAWQQGTGGGTGRNGFRYTYNHQSYARWHFGDLRGIYRAEHFYVKKDGAVRKDSCGFFNNNCIPAYPTASPQYAIKQCDHNYNNCTRLYTLNGDLVDEDGSRKQGWRGWEDLKLNGYIVVETRKRHDDNETRLAIDGFQFKWKDLLRHDKDEAIALCQANALNETFQSMNAIHISNFGKDLSGLLLYISVSYFSGLGAAKAPTVLSSLYISLTSLRGVNSARKVAAVAKEITMAIKTFQNATKYTDAAEYGLTFALDVLQLTDDLANTGVLGEHKHLYERYKDYCNHLGDTPIDWATGYLDHFGKSLSGDTKPGDGCLPIVGQISCVPGYGKFITNNLGVQRH